MELATIQTHKWRPSFQTKIMWVKVLRACCKMWPTLTDCCSIYPIVLKVELSVNSEWDWMVPADFMAVCNFHIFVCLIDWFQSQNINEKNVQLGEIWKILLLQVGWACSEWNVMKQKLVKGIKISPKYPFKSEQHFIHLLCFLATKALVCPK